MATHVKGNTVANATSYELAEKSGETYSTLKTKSELDFDLSELSFSDGDHTLVVRAKADGYTTSDWSNELTYTVGESGDDGGDDTPDITINIEQGSIGSSAGADIDSSTVWRTPDYIAIADLGSTLSVAGATWLIAVYNESQSYLGQLMTDFSGLVKNSGQWLESGTVVNISDITSANSNAAYVRLAMKTGTPQILVDGVDCFGELV